MRVEESIKIYADRKTIYSSFCNLYFWLETLPDVVSVKLLYSDVLHQEFNMTVMRPSGPETIRGIWFCKPNSRIDLCQFTPPPGFKKMTGSWLFQSNGSSTLVNVIREFDLIDNSNQSDSSLICNKIRHYLKANLQLFKKSIEASYAN